MTHFALSIAVADGPTMADVHFGFVYDFGPREEWYARRGEGAWLNGRRIESPPDERRDGDGRLEIVTFESADPRLLAPKIAALGELVNRLRAMGSIAISLCQLAPTRVDGMFTLRRDALGRRRGRPAHRARDRRLSSRFPASTTRSARRWTSSRTRASSPRARRSRSRGSSPRCGSSPPPAEPAHPVRHDGRVLDRALTQRIANAVARANVSGRGRRRRRAARAPARRPRGDLRRRRGARRRLHRPAAGRAAARARGGASGRTGSRRTSARWARCSTRSATSSPGGGLLGGATRARRRRAAVRRGRRADRLSLPARARPVRVRARRSRRGRAAAVPRAEHRAGGAPPGRRPRAAADVDRLPRGHPRRAVRGRAVAAALPRRPAARAARLAGREGRRRARC